MSEWEKVEGLSYECHRLRVGPIRADAIGAAPMWEPSWAIEYSKDDPAAFETESVDAAKAAAEQALREMHDALVAHFAPVLRWTAAIGGAGSVASVGGWMLTASAGCWSLRNMAMLEERDLSWLSPVGYSGDEAQARRDVEAALRSIGVVFRTEGDR